MLRRLLRQRRLSQSDFARLVGLSHTSVNRILLGRYAPRPKHVKTWCRALGLKGPEAHRLTLAMGLASAWPVVRAYVIELERRSPS